MNDVIKTFANTGLVDKMQVSDNMDNKVKAKRNGVQVNTSNHSESDYYRSKLVESSSEEEISNVRRSRTRRKKLDEPSITADNRMAPKLEKFREGGNIRNFFKMFEEYCRGNVRGSRKFWSAALEDHLEGRVLEVYKDLRDEDDEFEDTKDKLIQWYEDSAEFRTKGHKKRFKNAQRKEGDSLYLFSIRLESLFKRAYPSHDSHKSTKLLERFKKTISRKSREALESQIMNAKMKGENVDWSYVRKWAQLRDNVTYVSSDSDGDDSGSAKQQKRAKEININLSRGEERRYGGNQLFKRRSRSTERRSRSNNTHCYACGGQGHFANACELGQVQRCFNCGDTRHIARNCPNSRRFRDQRREKSKRRASFSSQNRDLSGQREAGQHYVSQYSGRNGRGNGSPFRGRGGQRDRRSPRDRGYGSGRGAGWFRRDNYQGSPMDEGSQYYGLPNQYGPGYQQGAYVYNPGNGPNPYATPFHPQQRGSHEQQANVDAAGFKNGGRNRTTENMNSQSLN